MQIQKYNIQISNETLDKTFKRLINQTYKLLPMREEGCDWAKPLDTVLETLVGIKDLLEDQDQETFFLTLCKLQGLHQQTSSNDFMTYRRAIFECLSLLSDLRNHYVSS